VLIPAQYLMLETGMVWLIDDEHRLTTLSEAAHESDIDGQTEWPLRLYAPHKVQCTHLNYLKYKI